MGLPDFDGAVLEPMMIRSFAALATSALLGVLAAAGSATAAQGPLAPSGEPFSRFPAPGRPSAPIVSADWGSSGERDAAREVAQIVARLGLKPGMVVGDLGAGRGYDTLRLAHSLGPHSRVIAEDVDPEPLQALAAEAGRERLTNVVIGLGEQQDPRLPPRSLDAAILVHMYHEVAHPYAFLYNLAVAMRPDGRVGVEELDRPTLAHGTPPALLRCEFSAVGYSLVQLKPLQGGLGYFAVFQAPVRPPAPQRIHVCSAS